MRRELVLGGIAGLLIAGMAAPDAHAVLTEWRVEAQSSLGGNGPPLTFDQDFGLNQATASTELVSANAHSQAFATLSPDGYVPTLEVLAVNDGLRAQAVAWGVQGYTNTSASVLDTALVLSLSANMVGPNYLEARMYLFQDESFDYARDSGTILFESDSILWPGFESYANNAGPTGFDVLLSNTPGAINQVRQFDFSVDPGDSFYVWARLLATADNAGEVDAFGTLTASFTNTAGLTPAAVAAAPEPSAAALLACTGLLVAVRSALAR